MIAPRTRVLLGAGTPARLPLPTRLRLGAHGPARLAPRAGILVGALAILAGCGSAGSADDGAAPPAGTGIPMAPRGAVGAALEVPVAGPPSLLLGPQRGFGALGAPSAPPLPPIPPDPFDTPDPFGASPAPGEVPSPDQPGSPVPPVKQKGFAL